VALSAGGGAVHSIKTAVSRCSNLPCAEGGVIRSPRWRSRAASVEFRGPAPWRFEVDHQLVLGRRLQPEGRRASRLENAINIAGRADELVQLLNPIGDQTTGGDPEAAEVDRRQFCAGPPARRSDRDEPPPMRYPLRSDPH